MKIGNRWINLGLHGVIRNRRELIERFGHLLLLLVSLFAAASKISAIACTRIWHGAIRESAVSGSLFTIMLCASLAAFAFRSSRPDAHCVNTFLALYAAGLLVTATSLAVTAVIH